MIRIKQVNGDRRGMRDFLQIPYDLYRNDPQWVPPLRIERKFFFSPYNTFRSHAAVAYFVAYEGNRAVGRVTAHTDQIYDRHHRCRQGFFGFFEARNTPRIAWGLMSRAESWLKKRRVDSILGPFNFSTNHEIGFIVRGFHRPPTFMMPYSKAYYPKLLYPLGYRAEKRLYTYWIENAHKIPPYMLQIGQKIRHRLGSAVEIRRLDKKNVMLELSVIQEIYNDAWQSNWGFTPMTSREVVETAKFFKLFGDPQLAAIVYYRGEAAAMAIALPDINEICIGIKNGRLFPSGLIRLLLGRKRIRTVRLLLMGVKRRFRGRGLELLILPEIFSHVVRCNYINCEFSWILEDNYLMNRMLRKFGISCDKEYLIVKKSL